MDCMHYRSGITCQYAVTQCTFYLLTFGSQRITFSLIWCSTTQNQTFNCKYFHSIMYLLLKRRRYARINSVYDAIKKYE